MLLVKGCVGGWQPGQMPGASRLAACSILCMKFRSSVETNKATADTLCTESPHGASSMPCDRLGRDMLEDPGSALYRWLLAIRIREWRSGEISHLQKMLVLWLRLLCVVWVFAREACWPCPLPEGREQGWWRGSALDVNVLAVSRRLHQTCCLIL